ncbi:aminoglycoside phosphotransferase family protein [Paenibacillus sp. sptzw28]|nr:aminoglycoside phosphotransferase family protein [Paenibacillus sp. sptzw28]
MEARKMRGGAQKVVYKLECTEGLAFILYVWDLSMNYFEQEKRENGETEESYGSRQFEANTELLTRLGIRTPAIYYINHERDRYPFDFAIVEYVSGTDIAAYYDADPRIRDKVFGELAEMLAVMHSCKSPVHGSVTAEPRKTDSCQTLIYKNARRQLSYASRYMDDIARNESEIIRRFDDLLAAIEPRHEFGFIHGELGPDHVFVSDRLEPYLIDIEGCEYFDIEHEHTFLQLRFQDSIYNRYLKHAGLDPHRMNFYKLHHHVSITSGGLKLLHRGFHDQEFARGIADYNSRMVLQMLGRQQE